MAVVPTKNPAALFGYYLGIGSIIPFAGLLFCLPALICGIIGAIKASKNPAVGGMGHAIAAIVLGLIGPAIGLGAFWLLTMLFVS